MVFKTVEKVDLKTSKWLIINFKYLYTLKFVSKLNLNKIQ